MNSFEELVKGHVTAGGKTCGGERVLKWHILAKIPLIGKVSYLYYLE